MLSWAKVVVPDFRAVGELTALQEVMETDWIVGLEGWGGAAGWGGVAIC